MIKKEKNLIVTQSNMFALADKKLGAVENNILTAACGYLNLFEWPHVSIPLNEMRKILNISDSTVSFEYTLLKKGQKLRERTWIEYNAKTKAGKTLSFINDVEINKETNTLDLEFNKNMKRHVAYIIDEKNKNNQPGFQKFHMYHKLAISNLGGRAVFENCLTKKHLDPSQWYLVFAVNEQYLTEKKHRLFDKATSTLPNLFGYKLTKAYSKWFNVKNKYLEKAMKAINEESSVLKIDYELLKTQVNQKGRLTVVGVKFKFNINLSELMRPPKLFRSLISNPESESEIKTDKEKSDLTYIHSTFSEFESDPGECDKLIKKFGLDRCYRNTFIAVSKLTEPEGENIKNKIGFIISTIQKNTIQKEVNKEHSDVIDFV